MEANWLSYIKRVHAIAFNGLTYATNSYDLERYQELKQISLQILSELSGMKLPKIQKLFAAETGYQTPKVDVRAVVIKDDKLLMVREKIDNCWSLPGGWADVGYSPGEVAAKEVWEETGLKVKPTRLLGVLDKKCHPHPPSPFHVYKIFIECEIIGGKLQPGMETSDAKFFAKENLPELSTDRITESQIKLVFEHLNNNKSFFD